MRLGVLGGTFDPPHVGHLLAASDALESLALDRVLFVPAAAQPFKTGHTVASAEQRYRMLELMLGGDPRFAADPIEIERGGLSYTVDTLEALRQREPEAHLVLLVGADLAGQLASWHEAGRMATLAEIVVLVRVGGPDWEEPGSAEPGVPLHRIVTRRVDLSSTEIRSRVRAGKSIHGFVTESVAAFIAAAGLYR